MAMFVTWQQWSAEADRLSAKLSQIRVLEPRPWSHQLADEVKLLCKQIDRADAMAEHLHHEEEFGR
jgi:hypothetical protein